jgi:hypothetical protein
MNQDIEKLIQLRAELIDLINQFDKSKRLIKLFDQWSLKDVLAHLAGWDKVTFESVDNLSKGKMSIWGGSVQKINDNNTLVRKDWLWDQVYQEFVDNSQQMIETYSRLPSNMWDSPLYPGKKFSPKKFLKIDINHYQEHLEEIKSKL